VLVPRQHPVRGYIAASFWGRTWYEHMLELERLRLSTEGKSPGEVDSRMKAFSQFYDLYLNQRMMPGEIISKHAEWKDLWYGKADGQYGRPAAFYQQLQALNLGEAWENINVPVLVMHGTADNIMSNADSSAIAEIVNHAHPGTAKFVQIENADHLLSVQNQRQGRTGDVGMDEGERALRRERFCIIRNS
jgi:pimeloyl-ACP methyl ester carboxylesterase